MAGVVRDLEKRRVKRKARRGSRTARGEGEVKGNIRCQTDQQDSVRPCQSYGGEDALEETHVDILMTGTEVSA